MSLLQKFRYKLTALRRRFFLFLGVCPKCSETMNYTSRGRPICPVCSR